MPTQVILLERVEHLGAMGDVVNVKPGYARNFLLPQNKALRATKDNLAYFEAQKAKLEAANAEKKKAAEKQAKTLEGTVISVIRQASEGGQLYGSVTARDIADLINESGKEKIERQMVSLNQGFKTIGLFPVDVALHPEVRVQVTVNIARSADEAATQQKTGKALITGDFDADEAQETVGEKEAFLEESALEAEQIRDAEAAEKEAQKTAKAEAKAAKKAAEEAAPAEDAGEADTEAAEEQKTEE